MLRLELGREKPGLRPRRPLHTHPPTAPRGDSRVVAVGAAPAAVEGVELVPGEGVPHVAVVAEDEHTAGGVAQPGPQLRREGSAVTPLVLVAHRRPAAAVTAPPQQRAPVRGAGRRREGEGEAAAQAKAGRQRGQQRQQRLQPQPQQQQPQHQRPPLHGRRRA